MHYLNIFCARSRAISRSFMGKCIYFEADCYNHSFVEQTDDLDYLRL